LSVKGGTGNPKKFCGFYFISIYLLESIDDFFIFPLIMRADGEEFNGTVMVMRKWKGTLLYCFFLGRILEFVGKMLYRSMGPSQSTHALSMTCRSSRTFPGHW